MEDILSAIRTGRFGKSCAMLGTWVNERFLDYVVSNGYTTVVCWFDNDHAGDKAYRQAKKKLSLIGVNVLRVSTDKDPKCYSNREINSILKGVIMND